MKASTEQNDMKTEKSYSLIIEQILSNKEVLYSAGSLGQQTDFKLYCSYWVPLENVAAGDWLTQMREELSRV